MLCLRQFDTGVVQGDDKIGFKRIALIENGARERFCCLFQLPRLTGTVFAVLESALEGAATVKAFARQTAFNPLEEWFLDADFFSFCQRCRINQLGCCLPRTGGGGGCRGGGGGGGVGWGWGGRACRGGSLSAARPSWGPAAFCLGLLWLG